MHDFVLDKKDREDDNHNEMCNQTPLMNGSHAFILLSFIYSTTYPTSLISLNTRYKNAGES